MGMKLEKQVWVLDRIKCGEYSVNPVGYVVSHKKAGSYKVSSIKKKLKRHITRLGYRSVIMSKGKKSVPVLLHCLVWLAHNGTYPENLELNHIDGNKANNRLDNLELCSRKENVQHAIRLGLMKPGNSYSNKKRIDILNYLCNNKGCSHRRAAKHFEVSHTFVSELVKENLK